MSINALPSPRPTTSSLSIGPRSWLGHLRYTGAWAQFMRCSIVWGHASEVMMIHFFMKLCTFLHTDVGSVLPADSATGCGTGQGCLSMSHIKVLLQYHSSSNSC